MGQLFKLAPPPSRPARLKLLMPEILQIQDSSVDLKLRVDICWEQEHIMLCYFKSNSEFVRFLLGKHWSQKVRETGREAQG